MAVLEHVKPFAEALLSRGGVAQLSRVLRPARDFVLAYHNVLPDRIRSGGDPSLHLPRSRFAAQLDRIQRECRVASLRELLDEPSPAEGERPRVALTFDDGYRGALSVGLEEIVARGLAATFFVSPALLGGITLWWDAVTDGRGNPLRGTVRRIALEAFRGDREAVLAWAGRCGMERAPAHPLARTATRREVKRAAARPGITLGSHGWSHLNLRAVDGERRTAELRRSLRWLEASGSDHVKVLSYPYGLASPEVEEAVGREGYRGALRVDGGGWPRRERDPMTLPRINVPSGMTADGLHLRLTGVLP